MVRVETAQRAVSRIVPAGLGLILFLAFAVTTFLPLKTFLLFFSSACLLTTLSWPLAHRLPALAEGHAKRLAVALSVLISAVYHLVAGEATVWTSLAWLFLVLGGLSVWSTGQRVFLDYIILRHLVSRFSKGGTADPPVPLVYIASEPGWGTYLANRLVGKLAQSLWRYRYRAGGIWLERYHHERSRLTPKQQRAIAQLRKSGRMVVFALVSESLRRYPREFRSWLIKNCSAFVIMHIPEDTLPEPIRASRDWIEFRSDVDEGLLHCPGPTFDFVSDVFEQGKTQKAQEGDEKLKLTWKPGTGQDMSEFIGLLVDRIATTSVPIALSDMRMTTELHEVAQEISTSGNPVVADCYLRFRLSQSDTERFITLVDAIEGFIRLAAVIAVVSHWQTGDAVRGRELVRLKPKLTLGFWVRLLAHLVRDLPGLTGVEREVKSFWLSSRLGAATKLMRLAHDHKFDIDEPKAAGNLGLLEWFNDFRNLTKGHGIVEEKVASVFWHELHELYLEMVLANRFTVLDSCLLAVTLERPLEVVQGWYRNDTRSYARALPLDVATTNYTFYLSAVGELLPLYPLVQFRGNTVSVWDSMNKQDESLELEMLNYSTGQRTQLRWESPLDGEPYAAWRTAKEEIDFIARQQLRASHQA